MRTLNREIETWPQQARGGLRARRVRCGLLALCLLLALGGPPPVVVAQSGSRGPTIALLAQGAVRAWGDDTKGQLGDGTLGSPDYQPTPQTTGIAGAIAIGASDGHSLALKADGTAWAWGDDSYGQLGDGTVGSPASVASPQPVVGIAGATAISAGDGHSLALLRDGTVRAWGFDGLGQLGDGTVASPDSVAIPQPVLGLSGVVAISAGYLYSLALEGDGTVWAWGWLYDRSGTLVSQPTPQQVCVTDNGTACTAFLTGVRAISASGGPLALKADGTVWAWGGDSYGQLGNGTAATSTPQPFPRQVVGLTGVAAIAGGDAHALALKGDGTVWAWGKDSFGELGDGIVGNPDSVSTPQQVCQEYSTTNGACAVFLAGVAGIGAGEAYSLAVKADGTVWAWGLDNHGQLGDGTLASPTIRPDPQPVIGLTGIVAVSAGFTHALALNAMPSSPGPSPSPSASPAPSASPSPSASPDPSTGPVPSFADVPVGYWAHDPIGTFAQRGITTGCDVGLYCPERPVTRAEMAVFLDRTLGFPTPPAPASQRFTDVPPAYWAYAFIDTFATLGITTGCGGTEFCPDRGVTRAEMAAFLIRALGKPQLTRAAPTFADVPAAHPQFGYIEALVNAGVTTGCGTNDAGKRLYCPDRGVTRAEMAVFIIRAFP